MRFAIILAASAAALVAASSASAGVIIERFPNAGPIPAGASLLGVPLYPEAKVSVGQTVTVENSGGLFQFDVLMSRSAPPGTPAITEPFSYTLSSGVGGPTLASGTFMLPGDLGTRLAWVPIELDETIGVAAGSSLFIVLNSPQDFNSSILWRGLSGGPEVTYPGGSVFRRTSCAVVTPGCGQWLEAPTGPDGESDDLGYRLYIDTSIAEVPEPGAVGLLGFGVLALGLRRRARPMR